MFILPLKPPVSRRKRAVASLISTIALIAIAATSTTSIASAPYLRAANPITDYQGRVQVTIDFADYAHLAYPDKSTLVPRTKRDGGDTAIEFFHKPQIEALVADFERAYGFKRTGMTSWVGDSVTTFVTLEQVKRLQEDSRVKTIFDDVADDFSWADSTSGGETTSWGRQAVNGQVRSVSNNRKVYIIDSGVAEHYDLGSVSARLNVSCGASNCYALNPSTYPVVGCYAHATHVAGIIGAQSVNGIGTNGVYAGANMVSLSVLIRVGGDMCADINDNTGTTQSVYRSRVGNALDYVYWDTLFNNASQLVNIANTSINSGGLSIDNLGPQANWARVQKVATPAYESIYIGCPPQQPECTYEESHRDYYYAGALVAQSAGNNDSNLTCDGYYSTTSTSLSQYASRHYLPYAVNGTTTSADSDDGIMVVGAVAIDGSRPSPRFSYSVPLGLANNDPGSNHGVCLDIWAPGDSIYSTWGNLSGNTVMGPPTPYSSVASISGTSMAAPHVAAAAAYYADTYNLTTPAAIERQIRANLNPAFTSYNVVRLQ